MNDHHLDDLIIGDPEPSSSTSKTLLTILALSIVVLIVGLLLWALLFDDTPQEETNTSVPEQQTTPLTPKLSPLEIPEMDVNKDKPKPTKPKPKPVKKPPQPIKKPKPAEPTLPALEPTTQEPSEPANKPDYKKLIKNSGKSIYYIQVGAFKRDPSPRFMKKLKNAGFTFITKTTKDIRRVRVGPYDTYQEAKDALPVVKSKIGIDGLIVKF